MIRPLAPHTQDILEEALSLTNGDRQQDYGDMQTSFERITATSEGEESGEEESTERCGSGDGERWTLISRQTTFEPLPASRWFSFRGLKPSKINRRMCENSICMVRIICEY